MEQTEQYKLPLKKLYFEITRKCNMSCAHCMRGEAQSKSMSKEVIDAALDNVISISNVFITGGEPFLEPELIEYLVDGIIKRDILIHQFGVVTNGSILDQRIADSFSRIGKYISTKMAPYLTLEEKIERDLEDYTAAIGVSIDEFHSKIDCDSFLNFYNENTNNHVKIMIKDWNDDEDKDLDSHIERMKSWWLTVAGRAKLNKDILNHKSHYRRTPYRTVVGDYYVETSLVVGWNGQIGYCTNSSWEEMDRTSMGNILEKHLADILREKAFDEPFTKDEANYRDDVYSFYMEEMFDNMSKEQYEFMLTVIDLEYATRERIHKVYPYLPWEKVVELARHDMNIQLKPLLGEDFKIPFMSVENPGFFDATYKESIQYVGKFKSSHLWETLVGIGMYKDKPLLGVPDKMTRERKEICF